ncbi:hypothetical protein, partial [Dyadobacter sp. CY326]|uniref:hypothetical protein n=1 Tax=Dyadobacter sp. CY326 TaxID=2907300 RepID=UPI001F2ACDF5
WFDVKGIAAPSANAQSIYIMNSTELYRVDIVTGALTLHKQGWNKVTAMSGGGGYLYIVNDQYLYRVTENNDQFMLSKGWLGASSIGFVHDPSGGN